MKILELGCGDGTLWTENKEKLPDHVAVTLSDISEGMLRDARRAIGTEDGRFSFRSFDCHRIPYGEEQFDLVIANHVLFYCQDVQAVCREVKRVLKPSGRFVCSTYGREHMKEVSQLVQEFDEKIVLSADKLYEKFGKENVRPGDMFIANDPYHGGGNRTRTVLLSRNRSLLSLMCFPVTGTRASI